MFYLQQIKNKNIRYCRVIRLAKRRQANKIYVIYVIYVVCRSEFPFFSCKLCCSWPVLVLTDINICWKYFCQWLQWLCGRTCIFPNVAIIWIMHFKSPDANCDNSLHSPSWTTCEWNRSCVIYWLASSMHGYMYISVRYSPQQKNTGTNNYNNLLNLSQKVWYCYRCKFPDVMV